MSNPLFKPLKDTTAYLSDTDKQRLYAAFCLAEKAHINQLRKDGDPYVTHPVRVAKSLAELYLDADCLIAALLHDVVEDTEIPLSHIEKEFGANVAFLVDGLSHLEGYHYDSINESQANNFSKMLISMAKDLRVIIIKLADRLDNIKTVDVFHRNKQVRIAQETLDIYAPIAEKIGLNSWRLALEDCSFKAMHPKRYPKLVKTIDSFKGTQRKLIETTKTLLHDELVTNGIHVISLTGREKSPYSIYRKIRSKKISVKQMTDLFAFRVIVKDSSECYLALGIIHSIYKPLPGRFKDYIALPKSNGYQSLHTVLINHDGIQAEVQIRTQEMDKNAEFGIAAHWDYKNGSHNSSKLISQEWLNSLLKLFKENSNKVDFFEAAKVDLIPEEIFVFTPKGEILKLPLGSTALDLAYAIHTTIGNHANFCTVNQQPKLLNYTLNSGDVVNIVTSESAHPTTEKLHFATTAKARSAIRHHVKNQQEQDLQTLGKYLLDTSLAPLFPTGVAEIEQDDLQKLLQMLRIESLEQLYTSIGKGKRPVQLVVKQLVSIRQNDNSYLEHKESTKPKPLVISGTESFALHFAKCCYPIHGDDIIGRLMTDKGVEIHRLKCNKVDIHNPNNWIPFQWKEEETLSLTSRFHVWSTRTVGIFAQISNLIDTQGIDITYVDVKRDFQKVVIDFQVVVKSRLQLANLFRVIRAEPNVSKVSRYLQENAEKSNKN